MPFSCFPDFVFQSVLMSITDQDEEQNNGLWENLFQEASLWTDFRRVRCPGATPWAPGARFCSLLLRRRRLVRRSSCIQTSRSARTSGFGGQSSPFWVNRGSDATTNPGGDHLLVIPRSFRELLAWVAALAAMSQQLPERHLRGTIVRDTTNPLQAPLIDRRRLSRPSGLAMRRTGWRCEPLASAT